MAFPNLALVKFINPDDANFNLYTPDEKLLENEFVYEGSDDWKSRIGPFIDNATAIVLLRGTESPGLNYELEEVHRRSAGERTIVINTTGKKLDDSFPNTIYGDLPGEIEALVDFSNAIRQTKKLELRRSRIRPGNRFWFTSWKREIFFNEYHYLTAKARASIRSYQIMNLDAIFDAHQHASEALAIAVALEDEAAIVESLLRKAQLLLYSGVPDCANVYLTNIDKFNASKQQCSLGVHLEILLDLDRWPNTLAGNPMKSRVDDDIVSSVLDIHDHSDPLIATLNTRIREILAVRDENEPDAVRWRHLCFEAYNDYRDSGGLPICGTSMYFSMTRMKLIKSRPRDLSNSVSQLTFDSEELDAVPASLRSHIKNYVFESVGSDLSDAHYDPPWVVLELQALRQTMAVLGVHR